MFYLVWFWMNLIVWILIPQFRYYNVNVDMFQLTFLSTVVITLLTSGRSDFQDLTETDYQDLACVGTGT